VLLLQHRPPAHVRLIAHSVREIRNRLPDYVSKVESGGTLNYKGRVDDIIQVGRRAGLLPSDFIARSDGERSLVPLKAAQCP
jgi:hypothetical protein